MTRVDKYKKEDPERAQAVMDHIHRTFDRHGYFDTGGSTARDLLSDLEPWLMDVFRAVRGDRD
jgi:hypothetical protein